jgi:hypothetical protein
MAGPEGRALTPEQLREAVQQWLLASGAGELSARELHVAAEALWESRAWPTYDNEDDRSIAIEILCQLDILDHQLVLPADIPALLEVFKARAVAPPRRGSAGGSTAPRWTSTDATPSSEVCRPTVPTDPTTGCLTTRS